MKALAAAMAGLLGVCVLAACESSSEYDGVSRFASTPYYGPGSPPREAPPAPEIPGVSDQAGVEGAASADPQPATSPG